MNTQELEKALDKVKSQVFLGNNASFLACIMCSLQFIWDTDVPTASVDGIVLRWNPTWFESLPVDTRKTVLLHELWHVARLHMIRRNNRDPEIWNDACDYVINNSLVADKYSFNGVVPLIDSKFDGLSEEEVYSLIYQSKDKQPNSFGNDLSESTSQQNQQITSIVVKAIQTAKLLNQGSTSIATIEEMVSKLMKPVIPWQTLLYRFFDSLVSEDTSWKRPNRRYQDMYMPSRCANDSYLKNLNYYFDVSGSVTSDEVARFNTEVKYIKETFNPEKLSIIQFDVKIQDVLIVNSEDDFDRIKVVGRGGTRLNPVREHIIDTKPTAAIIFSDLCCVPMQPLNLTIPIIWVVIANPSVTPTFGTTIHIER